jgi:hypothetical protein
MYGLSSASCSTNYTNVNSFSNLQTNNVAKVSNIDVNSGSYYLPINSNIFKSINCVNSSDTNLSAKNTSSLPNISINNNIYEAISCANSSSFNLPVENDVFEAANINSSSISNIPVNNNVFKVINYANNNGSSNLPEKNIVVKALGCINNCSSYNLPAKSNALEEKSSNKPATEVLEEMYKALKLDIPPVFTFRQETFTQKFFCSAGFMNKWYDTKEAFPNREGAQEAAAQSLLKIIIASEEYEKYLQVENQSTNHKVNVEDSSRVLKNINLKPTISEKTSKRRKKKNKGKNYIGKSCQYYKKKGAKQSFTRRMVMSNRQIKKLQKRHFMQQNTTNSVVELEQNTVQNIFCSVPVFEQESKPKKVKFDDKILILGEDVIPKPKSNSLKSIMSHKNQISSSQCNQIPNEPETYQTLVRELSEKDKIRASASKLLDEFCIISNIPKPKYNFCNYGYGNCVAEILVGNIKYVGERDRIFWRQNEAQEYVAERAFNTLYAESDENTRIKFRRGISLTLLPDISNKVVASFTLPQQRYEPQSYTPAFQNYDNQPLGILTHISEALNIVVPQQMVNISTMSTAHADPFSAPSVPNFGIVQTHQEIPTQIPTGYTSSTSGSTVPQQSTTSQFPGILRKLVDEKDWGFVDYQYSKTLQGYKCTCHVKKLKFTSNPCINQEIAKNQAAKIALLAFSEYGNEYGDREI